MRSTLHYKGGEQYNLSILMLLLLLTLLNKLYRSQSA